MQFPELVAHRGYAARYPENTLAALDAAMRTGALHVEIDVQLSKDARPMLFHDRTLERMCGVPGSVADRTAAELAALSAGEAKKFGRSFEDERVASLAGFAELLGRYPHVHAFVEVKRAAIERFGHGKVIDEVLPALDDVLPRVSVISFSLDFLSELRRAHPTPIGVVFDRWDELDQPIVRELAPEFVFCDLDGLPASGPLDAGDARVAIYEVADAQLALALHARGAELVETFEIGEMLASFEAMRTRARVT